MSDADEVIIIDPEDDTVHSSSSYHKETIQYKPNNIKEKMILARRILQTCKENTKGGNGYDTQKTILTKLLEHTGLPLEDLREILSDLDTRDRSFTNAFKNIIPFNDQTLDALSNDIRNIFVDFYVNMKKLPSKLNLLKELKDKAEIYIDEDLSIQKLVKNKLVKYHHIPKYNKYLLMEHPETVYKRTLYLKAIEEYRIQGRNIVYIDMRKLRTVRNPTFYVGLALLPHVKQLEKFLSRDLGVWGPATWMKRRILPNIAADCVVVMYQSEKCNKLTSYSSRREIMEWLDENNIAYGKNPHTAEVYALYKAHENKVEMKGEYDHLFAKAGIDVLNCSKKWAKLNCFQAAWDEIINIYEAIERNKLAMEVFKAKIINSTQFMTDNVEDVEKTLIEAEKKMITEDAKMETIIENMMEMINEGDIKMSDFPEDICSDKTENFEMHIGDVII